MTKTIETYFQTGVTPTLKMRDWETNTLVYTFALTEDGSDPGRYFKTDTIVEGRYRTILEVSGVPVQRSITVIGPNEDTIYHCGNWEGSIDIGNSYYLIGSGAFLVDLTVEDGSGNPIPAAQVSLYAAGDQRHAPTNSLGNVQFSSDAETWTVVITKPGFSFTPVTLTVTANVTQTYEMTPLIPVLPVLEDHQVHLQAYVFNEFGALENGVAVKVQMIETPNFPGIFDDKIAEYTSVGGVVTITNAFMTAWYHIWRGKSKPMKYYVPEVDEGVTVVQIDPILGNDEDDPCL